MSTAIGVMIVVLLSIIAVELYVIADHAFAAVLKAVANSTNTIRDTLLSRNTQAPGA